MDHCNKHFQQLIDIEKEITKFVKMMNDSNEDFLENNEKYTKFFNELKIFPFSGIFPFILDILLQSTKNLKYYIIYMLLDILKEIILENCIIFNKNFTYSQKFLNCMTFLFLKYRFFQNYILDILQIFRGKVHTLKVMDLVQTHKYILYILNELEESPKDETLNNSIKKFKLFILNCEK